jgi:hypothetical protein
MTTILIKKKDTAGAPAAGDLTNAAGGTEIAVNTATRRIYTKDAAGNVVELGNNATSSTIADLTVTNSTTLSYGTANQVQYLNASKLLVGSANMTFDGTTLTVSGLSNTGNTTLGNATSDTLTVTSTITSNLLFTDNTYDIGASGATRPRTLYLGTSLVTPSITNSGLTSGRVVYTTTGGLETSSANLLYSGTDLTVYGLTVGRGNNGIATNTAFGVSALSGVTSGTQNVAIGASANTTNTSGQDNVTIGYLAGRGITSSNYNVAIGTLAVGSNSNPGNSNTGVGYYALYSVTGSANTAVGSSAGANVTSGSYNVALGVSALPSATSSNSSVAIGYQSLNALGTLGGGSVAVGFQAAFSNNLDVITAVGYRALANNNVSGTGNTAFGYAAAQNNTSGSVDAFGTGALAANTTGAGNVAFGNSALGTNLTGPYQVAIGAGALYTSKAGPNTAVGYQAMFDNNTGVNNVAIGNGAMRNNTGGYNNVAVGGSAMSVNLNGIANTAVGHNSLLNVTNSYNTALGMYSGSNMGNSTSNTAIGYAALYTQTTGGSNTAVGNGAGYTTNGNFNTYVGWAAGNIDAAVGSTFNTYIGGGSGNLMTTGNNNTILGPYSGNANGWDIRATNGNIVLSSNGQPSLGMTSTNGWYFSANLYNSPMGTITSGKGTSYVQTSISGGTSIVDTGIYAQTTGIGYAVSSSAGGTYDCYLVGNPNAGGAGYSMPIYGQIMTNTGYDGSNVRDYITFVTIASFAPSQVSGLTVTAVFNIGGTEYTNIPSGTTNAQIRLKISGYNSGYTGAGAIYRIIAR